MECRHLVIIESLNVIEHIGLGLGSRADRSMVAVRSVFSKEEKLAIAALYCTSQPHRVSFVHKQKGISRI